MDALEIARWQFGITTVYHFMMVPLTIGLGLVVAVIQTFWYRTGKPEYLRMTKFWGKLFLINFIMGVATGIVQEFQFGMAWSEYSRFVGDVFGAPLAMEALLAFFVESTFLGLWIFGWKQLKPGVHLACLWIAVIGSFFSAYFIIVANSWMQHPVGVEMVNGRPRHDRRVGRLHQQHRPRRRAAHPLRRPRRRRRVPARHRLVPPVAPPPRRHRHGRGRRQGDPRRGRRILGRDRSDHTVWIRSLRIGAVVAMISFAGTAVTGDLQGKLMFEQQPMKMAAAEAACHDGTGFSVLSVGNVGSKNCDDIVAVIEVPGILSFLAKGDFTTEVKGVNSLLERVQGQVRHHAAGQPHLRRPRRPANPVRARHGSHLLGLPDDDRLRRPRPPSPPSWRCGLTRKGTVPASRGLMRLARVRDPRTVRCQRRGLDLYRDGPPAVRRRPQPGPQRHRPGLHVHRRGRLTRASRPARS